MKTIQRSATMALLSFALVPSAAFACATCGCSLSSDGATGFSSEPGWRLGLQYDFIDQSQLRHGTRRVSASEVAAINDAGGDQEVEHDTVNRYTTLSLGYAPNSNWNFRLFVPFVDRGHSTFGSTSNPVREQQLSTAKISGLGDVRLLATYQGFLEDKNLGIQWGIKLPTGRYGGANAEGTGIVGRKPAAFQHGPLASNASPDNLVDASLQAGTGSTDLIVGAFYHHLVSRNVDAFVNGSFQAAIASKLDQPGADFRIGNTTFASFGGRYEANPELVPQVQVNISHKGADQGALADHPDSAGTVVYLSPGVTAALGDHLQAFGFAQLPVHSNLAGYQLAPRWSGSVGLTYSF